MWRYGYVMFVPDGVNGECWCDDGGAWGGDVGRGVWWDLVGFGWGTIVLEMVFLLVSCWCFV